MCVFLKSGGGDGSMFVPSVTRAMQVFVCIAS